MTNEETRQHVEWSFNAFARAMVALFAGQWDRCKGEANVSSQYATVALKNLGFYFVPDCYMTWFGDSFAKLAKRSAKLGKEAPSFTVHGTDVVRVSRGEGRGYLQAYTMISIQGQAPVVDGTMFLARIEHTEAGNIVSCAPGIPEQPAWRTIDTRCDHCNAKRRRVDTFAVANDGQVKFIGRNCLADFIRGGDVESAIHIWKFLSIVTEAAGGDPEEWGSWGGGNRVGDPTPIWFAACAAKAIRQGGFVSTKNSADDRPSTASRAGFAAMPKPTYDRDAARAWEDAQPEEIDVALAARAAKWLAESTDVSGFMSNARVAMALHGLKHRHLGLVAAVPYSYRKNQERAAREAAKVKPAGFFGEVGKRYDLSGLKIVMVRVTEQWGTTTVVKLTDSEGRSYTWFASGEKTYEAGQVVDGKATVKKHDSNAKYGDSTHLTRCSFTVREEPAV